MRIFLDNKGVGTLWSQFKAKLAAHVDDSDIHVTAEEKAAWDGKAELTDIPTSLPANGGNSETVNNQNVEMSIYRNTSSFGASNTDTADTIWKALPPNSMFVIEAQSLTDPSWNFPEGTGQYSLLMIKLSNVRPLGMYLYPKSGGNVFFANVDVNGAYAGNWRRLCDGGDAETVGGFPSGRIMKYIASLPSKDCNEITEPGWYSFNGCDGHAPGSNSTISSGTYFILLNIPMYTAGYYIQIATFIHGAVNYLGKTYIRHCNNGVWTEWGNITDGGNAATLGTHPASDFLYANGFAGQIEKLFCDADTTNDLSSLFSIVPDDATLNDLNPGIYAVTTSAARESLGIPKEGWASGPSPSAEEAMQTPGGILIKFGRVFGGPNLNLSPVGSEIPGTFTDACAFFINNNGIIYHTSTRIQLAQNGGDPTILWNRWTVFLSNSWHSSDQIIINRINYLPSDVTVAAGDTLDMYPLKQLWMYPYTSGIAYGPTKTYSLSPNSAGTALAIKNTGSSALVLPAGQYLIRLT